MGKVRPSEKTWNIKTGIGVESEPKDGVSNAVFAATDQTFRKAYFDAELHMESYGLPANQQGPSKSYPDPTARQASKWRMKKGLAYKLYQKRLRDERNKAS